MAYEATLVDRRGPVAFIRFNRPDKLNAMSTKMKDEILAALETLEADDAVRVVVFTGAGDKAFVAGAGINEVKDRTAGAAGGPHPQPVPSGGGGRVSEAPDAVGKRCTPGGGGRSAPP